MSSLLGVTSRRSPMVMMKSVYWSLDLCLKLGSLRILGSASCAFVRTSASSIVFNSGADIVLLGPAVAKTKLIGVLWFSSTFALFLCLCG